MNHLQLPGGAERPAAARVVPAHLQLGGRDVPATRRGRSTDIYFARWLAITGALFLISAIAYAVRLGRRAKHDDLS